MKVVILNVNSPLVTQKQVIKEKVPEWNSEDIFKLVEALGKYGDNWNEIVMVRLPCLNLI